MELKRLPNCEPPNEKAGALRRPVALCVFASTYVGLGNRIVKLRAICSAIFRKVQFFACHTHDDPSRTGTRPKLVHEERRIDLGDNGGGGGRKEVCRDRHNASLPREPPRKWMSIVDHPPPPLLSPRENRSRSICEKGQ